MALTTESAFASRRAPAQRRSEQDFRAMLTNPEAMVHMRAAAAIAEVEPHLYRVAFCG